MSGTDLKKNSNKKTWKDMKPINDFFTLYGPKKTKVKRKWKLNLKYKRGLFLIEAQEKTMAHDITYAHTFNQDQCS